VEKKLVDLKNMPENFVVMPESPEQSAAIQKFLFKEINAGWGGHRDQEPGFETAEVLFFDRETWPRARQDYIITYDSKKYYYQERAHNPILEFEQYTAFKVYQKAQRGMTIGGKLYDEDAVLSLVLNNLTAIEE
jgi:hypothetical protein